jgi:hypothetical protein
MTTEGLGTVCLLTVAGLYCLTRGVLAFIAVGNVLASLLPVGLVLGGSLVVVLYLILVAGRARS